MLKNYFKLALRNLQRTKGYSFINLFGLTLGLTCCFFLYFYVADELSYDLFHANKERIYRVTFATDGDGRATNANGSFGPGATMTNDFPEVEKSTRVNKSNEKVLIVSGEKKISESGFIFADSTFFQIFSFPLVMGDPARVLRRPNTIVISETMAQKYFHGREAFGKTIEADFENNGNLIPMEITGIMKDIPSNSHIKANMIASLYSRKIELGNWGGFQPVYTYVLLHDASQVPTLTGKLRGYSKKYMGPEAWYEVGIQPLTDIHLKSALRSEFEANGSMGSVYVFSAIAAIVLLIACINFMMLSTARSLRRAKEVGLRKTMGAQRRELVLQFMGESFLYTLSATAASIALLLLLLPYFNNFTGKAIDLGISQWLDLLSFGLIIVILTTLCSGLYPSFFLSSFKPSSAMKSSSDSRSSLGRLRKGLVVVQFTISIVLLTATLIVFQQMDYVQQSSGAVGNGVIVLPLNKEIKTKYQAFRQRVGAIQGVQNAAGESILPSKGSATYCFTTPKLKDNYCAYTYVADPEFLSTHGYRIVAGRDLDRRFATDTASSFIVNQAAVKEMGFKDNEEAIGSDLALDKIKGKIVGVVENFNTWSLRDSVAGTVLLGWKPNEFSFFSVKAERAQIEQVLSSLKSIWGEFSDYPFDYFFLDESFAALHRQDQKMGQTLGLFACLAILISCLGMIGLVSYTTEQRTKEIGIRKALGATARSIVGLVTKDFILLVLIAFLIAAPIVWKVMALWLQGFAYHVALSPIVIAWGGVSALILALLSVLFNSLKAASANPVNALRDE
ncbi:MAG TPA: ABC transporter permease [Cyclobacteriaceae bacterium]|nr:ABC transporter permease [Cyclobacteriaceae bacterium]